MRQVTIQAVWISICIHIRIPIVPEVNLSEKNARNTAKFLKPLARVKDIELLPYHRLGMDTYRKMNVSYELPKTQIPKMEEMCKIAEIIKKEDSDRIVKIKGEVYEARRI